MIVTIWCVFVVKVVKGLFDIALKSLQHRCRCTLRQLVSSLSVCKSAFPGRDQTADAALILRAV